MIIEDNRSGYCTFETLCNGDAFEYSNHLYMKIIDPFPDNDETNAVSLTKMYKCRFKSDDIVRKVNAKVVIE